VGANMFTFLITYRLTFLRAIISFPEAEHQDAKFAETIKANTYVT